MYVANGATLKWVDDIGQGGAGAGAGEGKVEVGDKEKQNWVSDVKDWVNGVFGKKQSKKLSEKDILTNKLGEEFLRTWPDLVANNWRIQQFLYINKQTYYNSPMLNAIAAYKYWEENRKRGEIPGRNIINSETEYAIVAFMAWLDNLYTLNYIYSLNLDDLSKMNLPTNNMKKDERAPEPDKQNSGGSYSGGANKKLIWVGVGFLAVIVVSVIVYFATKKSGA